MIVTDGKPDVEGYSPEQLLDAAFRLFETDDPVLIEIGQRIYQTVEDYVNAFLSD
jgi:hypothetical protein